MREAFNRISPLSETDWLYLNTHVETVHLKGRDILLQIGQVENYLYFINEGLLRFYIKKDEREISLDFVEQKQIFCSFISYVGRMPSEVCIQALVPATVYRIHFDVVEKLLDESKCYERFARLLVGSLYLRKLQKEINLLTRSAEENYASILLETPQVVKDIPVKDMASYLGIHPDSLSRIRRKLIRTKL
ncbi:MAG: Crp/Fnr family transcriptional regulator [Siphonobacter sp.]